MYQVQIHSNVCASQTQTALPTHVQAEVSLPIGNSCKTLP